jgi:LuxR family transcriptional regulator, maltose regulon positive regulatory protein
METQEQSPSREPVAAPSHIIERPRLIKMMEESGARVIVLNAPAGYGKTTLARQWARSAVRRLAWVRCNSSSADVAALAHSLANLDEIVPTELRDELAQRIAVSSPQADVQTLAELFLDASPPWPDDVWLIVDDYQAISGSSGAEAFLKELIAVLSAQVLITTRARPAWIVPRQIVYGEVLEIDRTLLAMTDDEARLALSLQADEASPVVEHARGWPAVIGLAATLPAARHPATMPAPLLEFLADELFQGLDERVKTTLLNLSLSPAGSRDDAAALIGAAHEDLLGAAETAGFFSPSSLATDELHPLLRAFLRTKLKASPRALRTAAGALVTLYLREDRLDDAFAVSLAAESKDLCLAVFEHGFEHLLGTGRLATLATWLQHLDEAGVEGPILDLGAAELAFREGLHEKSHRLALEAARAFDDTTPRRAQALVRAGQAAAQADRMEVARNLFVQAQRVARSEHDHREALLGELFAALELESADLGGLVDRIREMAADDVATDVRRQSALLVVALRTGGLLAAVERADPYRQLISRVRDPFTRAAFTNALAHACNATARYSHALDLIRTQSAFSRSYRLDFAVPHTLHAEVISLLGLNRLQRASRVISELASRARVSGDVHFRLNADVLHARYLLLTGDPEAAVRILSPSPEPRASAGLRAEYLATRALAELVSGHSPDVALASAQEAASETRWLAESAVLTKFVEVTREGESDSPASSLIELVVSTGQLDAFLLALRASPDAASCLLGGGNRELLKRTFSLAEAPEIAGLPERGAAIPKTSGLSRRERDVYELLCKGMSNREIARELFLSEKTIKVHLRHIYEKLGVRTRVQAAILSRDPLSLDGDD